MQIFEISRASLFATMLLAGACAPGQTVGITDEGPPDARGGVCYSKNVTPALVEVVTETKLVAPAKFSEAGTVIKPAEYQTETHQKIVRARQARFHEVLCPGLMTPEFVASMQRALRARQYYAGPITGVIGPVTRQAISAFNLAHGTSGEELTPSSARQLGLITYDATDGSG